MIPTATRSGSGEKTVAVICTKRDYLPTLRDGDFSGGEVRERGMAYRCHGRDIRSARPLIAKARGFGQGEVEAEDRVW